jgi:hypothetical protein
VASAVSTAHSLVTITIVKDDIEALSSTLQSISCQTVRAKHLVVDGSSNLQNQRIVKDLCEQLGSQYYFQKAAGIYSAMNFALEQCVDTDMVVFLNAGDSFFEATTTETIVKDIHDASKKLLLYNCVFGNADGFVPNIRNANAHSVAQGKAQVCHQGVVASVELIKSVGMFDTSYSISADHKLLLQMLKVTHPNIEKTTVAIISLGGVSDLNCTKLAKENSRARRETGLILQSNYKDIGYTFYRIVRCKAKLIFRRISSFVGLHPDFAQRLFHARK